MDGWVDGSSLRLFRLRLTEVEVEGKETRICACGGLGSCYCRAVDQQQLSTYTCCKFVVASGTGDFMGLSCVLWHGYRHRHGHGHGNSSLFFCEHY